MLSINFPGIFEITAVCATENALAAATTTHGGEPQGGAPADCTWGFDLCSGNYFLASPGSPGDGFGLPGIPSPIGPAGAVGLPGAADGDDGCADLFDLIDIGEGGPGPEPAGQAHPDPATFDELYELVAHGADVSRRARSSSSSERGGPGARVRSSDSFSEVLDTLKEAATGLPPAHHQAAVSPPPPPAHRTPAPSAAVAAAVADAGVKVDLNPVAGLAELEAQGFTVADLTAERAHWAGLLKSKGLTPNDQRRAKKVRRLLLQRAYAGKNRAKVRAVKGATERSVDELEAENAALRERLAVLEARVAAVAVG